MSDEGKIRDSQLTDRFDWNSRDGVTFDAGRMSASEKLKALEPATRVPFTMTRLGIKYDGIDCEAEDAHARLIALLPRALPQIVAVVEAAELAPYPNTAGDYPYVYFNSKDANALRAALTALEEALS